MYATYTRRNESREREKNVKHSQIKEKRPQNRKMIKCEKRRQPPTRKIKKTHRDPLPRKKRRGLQ